MSLKIRVKPNARKIFHHNEKQRRHSKQTVSRICEETVKNFNKLGKLSFQTRHQACNQLTQVKDWNNRMTSYTYDSNGRLKTISQSDGSTENHTYNAAGQLNVAEDKKSSGEIINRYEYGYDADGNIITENSVNKPNATLIVINYANMTYGVAN